MIRPINVTNLIFSPSALVDIVILFFTLGLVGCSVFAGWVLEGKLLVGDLVSYSI